MTMKDLIYAAAQRHGVEVLEYKETGRDGRQRAEAHLGLGPERCYMTRAITSAWDEPRIDREISRAATALAAMGGNYEELTLGSPSPLEVRS